MVIPKKVRIGGIVYEVRIADNWDGRDGFDGECFYNGKYGNVIFIGADLTREAQEATFVHEALHAMNSTMDHDWLDSFSEQIYAFLSDNKLLK